MKFSNELHSNLFARVFTYSAHIGSDRLEDFCTETLAWCLISAPTFEQPFLRAIKADLQSRGKLGPEFRRYSRTIAVSTQVPYSPQADEIDSDEYSDAGRFDLMFEPQSGSGFVIVIENKITQAKDLPKQIDRYRRELTRRDYRERYVVSLTPESEAPQQVDAHISWSTVMELLEDCERDPLFQQLQQFATFLREKGLGLMKLQAASSARIKSFSELAPWLTGLASVFRQFRQDPLLRSIFKARVDRPTVESDREQSAYYAIEAFSTRRYWRVAFYFKAGKMWQYVETATPGNRIRGLRFQNSVLREATRESQRQFGGWRGFKDDQTQVWLIRHPPDGADARDMFEWFRNTIHHLKTELK